MCSGLPSPQREAGRKTQVCAGPDPTGSFQHRPERWVLEALLAHSLILFRAGWKPGL